MQKKTRKFLIFTCNHDDASWCGKKCTNVISETEWLDVVYKGKLVEINSRGKIREIKKQKTK